MRAGMGSYFNENTQNQETNTKGKFFTYTIHTNKNLDLQLSGFREEDYSRI